MNNYEFSVCSLHLMDSTFLANSADRVLIVASYTIYHWENPVMIKIFASQRHGSRSAGASYWLHLNSSEGKKEDIALINQETHLDLAEEDLFRRNQIIL